MKNIIISALLISAFSSFANAETIWYAKEYPDGLSTLTGVFDKKGLGIMFACTGNFLSAGAIAINKKEKVQEPQPITINLTTNDNQNVNFSAEAVPSSENNYSFMSSDAISSLTAFHFLDTASNMPLHINLEENDISVSGGWTIQTRNSKNAVNKFKKSCPLLSNN
ncbi:hypothetical protein JHW33_08340 [Rahnella aceris]|uniref:hypothetical protein n=1 Tax=Rahnella sp. (strain Y9602) TaxID=2703885 RepID=UPI001903D88E|nr:hypothetical protein [Rahnella aceris]QQN36604.1 hypothetical protein JHW33_08340 [Rahnella aceris]